MIIDIVKALNLELAHKSGKVNGHTGFGSIAFLSISEKMS